MVTAVGLCLAMLGIVGATLAAWQVLAWLLYRGLPVPSPTWAEYGVTGELFAAFFEWLPVLLLLAVAFHAFVAWLGFGLFRRRPGARVAAIGFAFGWAATAVLGWLVVRHALEDLARGYPDRAGFALAAEALATQVTLFNVAIAAGLVLLMIQPAVRAQFPR